MQHFATREFRRFYVYLLLFVPVEILFSNSLKAPDVSDRVTHRKGVFFFFLTVFRVALLRFLVAHPDEYRMHPRLGQGGRTGGGSIRGGIARWVRPKGTELAQSLHLKAGWEEIMFIQFPSCECEAGGSWC